MKKGNRMLAMFLASVMLVTSIAWDFSDASVAEAEETTESTSAITQTDDGVSINFDNIDVAELDANGYTSTKFVGEAAVSGEVNRAVSEHWFSGDGDDTPYGSGEGTEATGKNVGLKSNDITDSNTRTIMYTPCSYEDFTVSAEVYYGAYSGIVLGEKNVYPTESNDASSVVVFFNSGRINIMGAVDRDSAKIMRGSSTAIANNGDKVGYKIFNNGSGETIKSDAGNVYTLNVKKTGNHLIIWYSGGTGLITIKLTDAYRTGAIGIQSRAYDGDNGGFKSLSIEKVHATETRNLDNADVTVLDDLGYSATFGGTVVNNSVGNAFFSGTSNSSETLTSANEGLKGTTTGTSVSGLNIPYIYENFRLEAEVYSGQLIGVAVGDASSFPRSSDNKMLSVFYNMHGGKIMLQMEGAYTGSWTRTGGAAGTNGTQWRPTINGSAPADTRDVVYTLVLEVRNGKATVWMEGFDGYVTATLASTYETEKIALIARHSSNDKGGIKGYTITNLDAGNTQDFDNVNLSNLDAAGYTARADGTSTLATVSSSGLWFSGDSTNYSDTEQYTNIGLKPSNTNTTREILNTPNAYENFRLETELYHGQVLGVKIGLQEKGTQVSGGSATSGSVSIYINGENLAICGAINYATAQLNGATTSVNTSGYMQYKPTGNSAKWNQARTLIIEVQDGVLSVSFADLNHTLKVKLDSSYKAESIALFARRYDTASGSAGGGFKGYTIEKLPSANMGTTVDVGGHTDFKQIDTSELDEAGFTTTQYDISNNYTPVATNQPVSTYMFAGEVGVNASGTVVVDDNVGLKPNTTDTDGKMTILNTPYTYDEFRLSTEVYWGAYTGIVLGEKNVFPTSTEGNTVRIYFNGNQVQLVGGGVDKDTVVISGGGTGSKYSDATYIFYPSSTYAASQGTVYKMNMELIDGVLTIWVDGHDGVLTVKMSDAFMEVENKSIALVAKKYDGDGGGFKSLDIKELSNMAIPYTADDFATYRSTDSYTAPTYKNYLFAGWYYDETCEQNVGSDIQTVEETVYAKFVPKYILDVKAQVSAHLSDELDNDSSGQIRFVTTVDSLKYSQVGFKVTYMKDGELKNKGNVSKEVYPTLDAVASDKTPIIYEPTDFCYSSIYFKAYTIKNVGQDYFDTYFTATAYWVTKDGTTVEGETRDDLNLYSHWVKRAVYLSDSGSDDTGIGSPNRPYQTLNNAIAQVEDNGTVYINDTSTVTNDTAWEEHDKTVIISGVQEDAASVLQADSAMPRFCIEDAATFRNLTFKLLSTSANSVHAEGHSVTIESSVKVEGVKEIYGGSRFDDVERTDLKLYAGTYEKIYGGSYEKTVGSTNLVVGGNVNKGISETTAWSNHSHVYMIFGGSEIGTVTGNTNVTIEEGSEAIYIYGGGRNAGSQVLGSTNVNFSGKAMSIYGGSGVGNDDAVGGISADTNVVITGGTVAQVFGGSESTSVIGDGSANVNLQILGGTVTRRIYGGCYNNYTPSLFGDGTWESENHVTGYTNVIIGAGAIINVDSGTDHGLLAVSRYGSMFDDEWGTIIFKDGIDLTSKLGSSLFETKQSYHYLVKAGEHGDVVSKNGLLYVTPEDGYKAAVTYGESNTVISANSDGTYSLPTLTDTNSKTTIKVTFSK